MDGLTEQRRNLTNKNKLLGYATERCGPIICITVLSCVALGHNWFTWYHIDKSVID